MSYPQGNEPLTHCPDLRRPSSCKVESGVIIATYSHPTLYSPERALRAGALASFLNAKDQDSVRDFILQWGLLHDFGLRWQDEVRVPLQEFETDRRYMSLLFELGRAYRDKGTRELRELVRSYADARSDPPDQRTHIAYMGTPEGWMDNMGFHVKRVMELKGDKFRRGVGELLLMEFQQWTHFVPARQGSSWSWREEPMHILMLWEALLNTLRTELFSDTSRFKQCAD